MASTVRAFFFAIAFVAVGAFVVFEASGCFRSPIGFIKLEVVNNTGQAVKIQPCWDLSCYSINGLRTFVLGPGDAKRLNGRPQFASDVPEVISIGVSRPNAAEAQYEGCVIRLFQPNTKVGVLRVTARTLQPCPVPSGGVSSGG